MERLVRLITAPVVAVVLVGTAAMRLEAPAGTEQTDLRSLRT
jgi:hypothetical protein